jgi:DNA-binding beta-propeller fold protein YncE
MKDTKGTERMKAANGAVRMKGTLKKLIAGAAAFVMSLSVMAVNISAESYVSYNYDDWGDPIPSQAGYIADKAVSGVDIGVGNLYEPADLFIDGDDLLYIADRKNNRIVVTDLDFNLVRIYDTFIYNGEETYLKEPQGIFVDDNTGYMYICDALNDRVIKSDKEGNVIMLFTKPDSILYGAETTFNPFKVCVDQSGNVYVVVKSVNRGAIMYDNLGNFLGFYGANTVLATSEVIANAFWNLISTEEQRLRTMKSTPVSFSNFDIDGQFIYTVTESTTTTDDQVKKLNPRGDNVLDAIDMAGANFGDIAPAYYSIYTVDNAMVDIDIGENGTMTLLDTNHGRIHQFDRDGWRLFLMGGIGWQLGQFQSAVALETHGDRIYVADIRKNTITVFTRTVFGELVTEAAESFTQANYDQSKETWEEVLRYDENYIRAYTGIGLSYLFDKNYLPAMENFRIALNQYYYNQAFEGYRNNILKANFALIVIVLAIIVVGILAYRFYRKRHPKKKERGV